MSACKGGAAGVSSSSTRTFSASPGPEAETELIALLVQCLAAFGLTEQDFACALSDRNLWCYYLEALGLDEPRIRAVLGAVDKYEKIGDEAFKPYTEKFGPLDPAVRAQVLAFLQIKSLAALEQTLAPLGGEKLAARLAEWRQLLDNLAAMGLGRFVEVDLGVVRGWPTTRASCSRPSTARANCARSPAAGATTTSSANSAWRSCRRWALQSRHDLCPAARAARPHARFGAGPRHLLRARRRAGAARGVR